MIPNDKKDKDGNPIPLSSHDKMANAKEMLEKGEITQVHYDAIEAEIGKTHGHGHAKK